MTRHERLRPANAARPNAVPWTPSGLGSSLRLRIASWFGTKADHYEAAQAPVLFGHVVLLPLNIVRLAEVVRATRATGDLT